MVITFAVQKSLNTVVVGAPLPQPLTAVNNGLLKKEWYRAQLCEKSGIVLSEILRHRSRRNLLTILFSKLYEKIEKNRNAQIVREIEITLPVSLTKSITR